MRLSLLLATLSLSTTVGCIGPAADVAANGLVLGGPADTAFAGIAQPFEAGVVLARPVSLNDLESNLIDDAELVWINVDGAPIELRNSENGLYLYDAQAQPAVQYQPGSSIEVRAQVEGENGVATVIAPEPPDLSTLPPAWAHGQAISVDMGDEFALAYGAVIDSQGFIVWDSRPASTEEIIGDLLNADPVERFLFPQDAFEAPGVYGLAIVGIREAEGADIEGFGKFWSNVGVGAIGTGYVTITP